MMRIGAVILVAFALPGCVESRETTLAQCSMEARKHERDEISRYAFSNLCMRAKGFQRSENCWKRHDLSEDAQCFYSANAIARAFDKLGDAIGR